MLPPSEMIKLGWPHQSWMSPGLTPAQLKMAEIDGLVFVHHETQCIPVGASMPTKAYGHTVWIASTLESRCVAVAFDWAVIERGLLVIADPMRVASNLWPIDEEGAPLGDSGRFRVLNTVVWMLQWQAVVMAHIPCEVTQLWKGAAQAA